MRNRLIANDNLFIPIKTDEFYKYHPEGQLIIITDLEWNLYKNQIKNTLKSQLSPLYKEELYFEAITEETAKYIEGQYYFLTMPKCSHYVGVFGNGDLLGVIGYNVSDSECRIYRFALKARYILDLNALSRQYFALDELCVNLKNRYKNLVYLCFPEYELVFKNNTIYSDIDLLLNTIK